MYKYVKSEQVVEAAINPQTVAMVAEAVGPLVVELLGKYWETHQDTVVDEIAEEAVDEIEAKGQSNEKFSMLKAFIDENPELILETVQNVLTSMFAGKQFAQ